MNKTSRVMSILSLLFFISATPLCMAQNATHAQLERAMERVKSKAVEAYSATGEMIGASYDVVKGYTHDTRSNIKKQYISAKKSAVMYIGLAAASIASTFSNLADTMEEAYVLADADANEENKA